MQVRRRSGDMSHPIGGPIKNAVTQRKDGSTTPAVIRNQVAPSTKAMLGHVKNAVSCNDR